VNHAAAQPVIERMPDRADDGMYVTRETHRAPENGADVVLYVIHGGGHSWPGSARNYRKLGETTRDIDADDVMWDFFVRHVK
jgi:polyhydroxybutyrate depolymerase